jgi:DNA-binding PadR family transcriptional regulator
LITADLDDLDEHTVPQSLHRLSAHGYVDTRGALGAPVLDVIAVHERGLRAARFWPDEAEHLAERIMAALTEAAEQEPEAEKRGRLRREASSVGEMGRDVFAEVLASVITKSAGMG